ncbi:MAG: response regulator [Phycisphaeraceae bacterium]|nr:response regulator [Phycisphaeraceae bacterium]
MSSTPVPTHGPARLVVADDETHIRLVVAEKFRAAGHIVFEARDGEEALDLVREHRPDAIITDLQMPYMSGLELCERLAQDAAAENRTPTPTVLLTARGHILEPEQLLRTGIRRVIGKPFGVRDLLEYVQTHLLAAPVSKPDPADSKVECRAA